MVYQNVERIRKAKGVTKTYLAGKLNISLQGYRHITSGSVRLDVERLKIIADELGVPPAVFFDNKLTETFIDKSSGNEKMTNDTALHELAKSS